jgi:hypothetical protein
MEISKGTSGKPKRKTKHSKGNKRKTKTKAKETRAFHLGTMSRQEGAILRCLTLGLLHYYLRQSGAGWEAAWVASHSNSLAD